MAAIQAMSADDTRAGQGAGPAAIITPSPPMAFLPSTLDVERAAVPPSLNYDTYRDAAQKYLIGWWAEYVTGHEAAGFILSHVYSYLFASHKGPRKTERKSVGEREKYATGFHRTCIAQRRSGGYITKAPLLLSTAAHPACDDSHGTVIRPFSLPNLHRRHSGWASEALHLPFG